ncbi:tetratricopeptide repeat protein [Frigoriglobus tundricola]|uniref:Uncharacterized protein n=1 Tax=Frigoriglobus tundricola TaxID=2774151 RepID=A0A6M5Z416_9BACT|nr:tetratricopeptide repeat protein [Frigoriglobus tundricola]QJX00836.1 hypothetical protein FTUN_8474 [Frigoriglobus tundricola]
MPARAGACRAAASPKREPIWTRRWHAGRRRFRFLRPAWRWRRVCSIWASSRALALFQAVRAEEPTNLLALFGVGRAASYLGRWDEAERAFRAVLELRPGHVETLLALAQVVEQRGDLPRALGYLEEAERGDPKRLETLSRLVKLLSALGQSERAGQYEQRYRELDPTGKVTGREPQPSGTP